MDLHCGNCDSFILTEKKRQFEKKFRLLTKKFQGSLPYTLEFDSEIRFARPFLLCSACKSQIGFIAYFESNIHGNPIIEIYIDTPCLIAYENKDDESDVER